MLAQIINAMLGIWLMIAPSIFGFDKTTSNNDHIVGPVIASFAIISFSECNAVARKFNIPLGAWLLLAPWVLSYANTIAIVNDMAAGIAVILLSLVKVKIKKRYGGGWKAIWKSGSLHEIEAKQHESKKFEMP